MSRITLTPRELLEDYYGPITGTAFDEIEQQLYFCSFLKHVLYNNIVNGKEFWACAKINGWELDEYKNRKMSQGVIFQEGYYLGWRIDGILTIDQKLKHMTDKQLKSYYKMFYDA